MVYNDDMKKIFLILMCIICTMPVQAKHLYKEAQYRDYWCGKQGGVTEYRLKTGERVDCLLPDYAVELDFARKYNECVGQAFNYATVTRRSAMCVLIMENKKNEEKYKKRAKSRIEKEYTSINNPKFVFVVKEITKEGLEQYYKRKYPELIKQLP